jgi:selenocysteine lyase/cysteine desulfurase
MRKACLAAGFNVSVSRRPSTRIDFENRGLHEVVRASVHYYNTDDEIAAFAALIANTT